MIIFAPVIDLLIWFKQASTLEMGACFFTAHFVIPSERSESKELELRFFHHFKIQQKVIADFFDSIEISGKRVSFAVLFINL